MPRIIIINRQGEEATVSATTGLSIMQNIRDNGFDELRALCGGCCSCGTCHVYVDPEYIDKLPPMGEDEDAFLSGSAGRVALSRLSCQLMVTAAIDGARITIAPE